MVRFVATSGAMPAVFIAASSSLIGMRATWLRNLTLLGELPAVHAQGHVAIEGRVIRFARGIGVSFVFEESGLTWPTSLPCGSIRIVVGNA